MKNILTCITLIFISLILLSSSCKKEKTGIEGLPPITQSGKGTFGCLVNGVLHIPGGSTFGGPVLQCFYQNLSFPDMKGFYFGLSGFDFKTDVSKAVYIQADSLELRANTVYKLGISGKGGASGIYSSAAVGTDFIVGDYKTNNDISGELKISRFDYAQSIISGTFWFDAINSKGEKVEIREGRFDMRFTK